ncbi:hypothetical protein ACXZ9C_11765 [Streptococcus agalactiae]
MAWLRSVAFVASASCVAWRRRWSRCVSRSRRGVAWCGRSVRRVVASRRSVGLVGVRRVVASSSLVGRVVAWRRLVA